MKRLFLALTLLATASAADLTVTTTTDFAVKLVAQPNGPLDAPLSWTVQGPATLQTIDALNMLLVSDLPCTNLVTVVGISKGNALTSTVSVTFTPGVPPATTLGIHAETHPK